MRTKAGRPVRSPKRKRLESREGAVITSLALPRPLHQAAMLAAVRLNWTLATVMRAALEEWLTRHRPELKGDAR